MPAITPAAVRNAKYSWSLIDYSGAKDGGSITVPVPGATTDQDLADLITAGAALIGSIGDLSNAAVIRASMTIEFSVNPACDDVVVLDEAYASVGTAAVLSFRDPYGRTRYVTIPAIDASALSADRRSLDLENTAVVGIINDVLNNLMGYVDTPPFEPCFVSSHLVHHRKTFPRIGALPTIEEPDALTEPPDAPALPPEV